MQVVVKLPRCVLPRYTRPQGTALPRDSRPPGTALPRDPRLLLVRRNHTSEDLWTNYEQAKSWLRCKVRFAYFRLVWSVTFSICAFLVHAFSFIIGRLETSKLVVTTVGVFPLERVLFISFLLTQRLCRSNKKLYIRKQCIFNLFLTYFLHSSYFAGLNIKSQNPSVCLA
jgi:hypothetical protein